MSIKLMSQVWDKQIDGNHQLVLLALTDWANDAGHCWPSLDLIAWKTGFSKRTVQRLMNDLADRKILTRQRRYHSSTVYTLDLSQLEDKPPFKSNGQDGTFTCEDDKNESANPRNQSATSASQSAKSVNESATVVPKTIDEPSDKEPSIEPSVESSEEDDAFFDFAQTPKGKPTGADVAQKIKRQYGDWINDPVFTQAARQGKVPMSRYHDLIWHVSTVATDREAQNPRAYALAIVRNYDKEPLFDDTPDDRSQRGRTPTQPG